MHFKSTEFSQKVEQLVEKLEEKTQVEIIVVIADKSGSYADVDLRWALILLFLGLTTVVFSPWSFGPYALCSDVMLLAVLGYFLSLKIPFMRRLLTREVRRIWQVSKAALQVFMEENVSATKDRTGVLIYVSLLERSVVVQPDLGIDGQVPRSEWNRFINSIDRAKSMKDKEQAFFDGLELLGTKLAELVPAAQANPNEIPNAPRFRN